MAAEERKAGSGGWSPYAPKPANLEKVDTVHGLLGIRVFRMILWATCATLFVIILRDLVGRGALPIADLAALFIALAALRLLGKRPDLLKPLSWLTLIVLTLDTVDGLIPGGPNPITPTHVLMPMLVLYGGLLYDLGLIFFALAAVLALCAFTWVRHSPLGGVDQFMLFNVILAAIISGFVSFGIWMHHRRMMAELQEKSEALKSELEVNARLNSVIAHDIRNALSAVMVTAELAELEGAATLKDVKNISRMAGRIESIIDSASMVNADRLNEMPKSAVPLSALFADLEEIFSPSLRSKELRLVLAEGGDLEVFAVQPILVDSILGNMVRNAMKFSPPSGEIEIGARREEGGVRITVRDHGTGFPDELLADGSGRATATTRGTEGERGTGVGLDVVAYFMGKLGGRLELKNMEDGGAAASVILPAKGMPA